MGVFHPVACFVRKAGLWPRAFGLLLWLTGVGSGATADEDLHGFLFRNWQTEEGLPQNHSTSIVQTKDGYLWLGTYNGLTRFDGVRFYVFNTANTPGLRSSRVTSLHEGGDGVLWIGHDTGEITRLQQGVFESRSLGSHWPGGTILSIHEDGDHGIWVLHETGLMLRVGDGATLAPEPGARPNAALSVAADASGRLWRAHEGTVREVSLNPPKGVNAPAVGFVVRVCPAQGSGLWLACSSELARWVPGEEAVKWGAVPWGNEPVTAMLESHSGLIWVGTQSKGLFILNRNGAFTQITQTNGLAHDWVRSLGEDVEGTVWIGTGAGVCAARKRRVTMAAPPQLFLGRTALSVHATAQGALWVGTEGAGVYRWEKEQWTHFDEKDGLENLFVWSVAQDLKGRIWVGTWGRGLFEFRNGRFESRPALAGERTAVASLLTGSDGALWVGTQKGLLRIKDGKTDRFAESWKNPDVRAIAEGKDGSLWFGLSGGGLGRLQNGTATVLRHSDGLPSDYVWSLLVDADDPETLWIGTFGGGLCRLRRGVFSVIGEAEGLPNGIISHLVEDGHGFVWCGSYGGIVRASKEDLVECAEGRKRTVPFYVFGKGDGLDSLECSGGLQPAGCRSPDGRLWFPTGKGPAVIDPSLLEPHPVELRPQIEEMVIDGRAVSPLRAEIRPVVDPNAEAPSELTIPAGDHRLEFRFTAPFFAVPERVRFRYRLEGLETEWVEAGSKRVASYGFLPPGRYSFHVAASQGDGRWSEKNAVLSFTLLPRFWQTVWFRAFAVLACSALIAGLARVYTQRQFRLRMAQLERQRAIERERTRIAQDIHDDLGASLTRIILLSQTARADLDHPAEAAAGLDRIYSTARELTRAMDEIVWAVNPSHDTLDSLVNYLGSFAQKFLGDAKIRCRLDLPLNTSSMPLSAEIRHNVFLSFKEALHNLVKHAAATEARIALSVEDHSFTLTIEDDGRGFTPGEAVGSSPVGDGLKNMRQRLEEIGGTCSIRSCPGSGTTVELKVQHPAWSQHV